MPPNINIQMDLKIIKKEEEESAKKETKWESQLSY